MKLGFAGFTHLGLVSAICSADMLGSSISCFDSEERLAPLRSGNLPVFEPGLEAVFGRARPHLELSSDPSVLGKCSVVVVSLDVSTIDGDASVLDELRSSIEHILPSLAVGAQLVVMSQIPLGEMRRMRAWVEARRPGSGIDLIYWVETLVIGQAVDRFRKPERMIVGTHDGENPGGDFVSWLTRFDVPLHIMSYESAELTKEALNLYLSLSVSCANFLGDLCERYGASMKDVVPALRGDRRIGPYAYLQPGLGISGGNLERDLVNLRASARSKGVDDALVDTVIAANRRTFTWAIDRLGEVVDFAMQPTVACWGIAYKRDTQSTKNSFAVRVLEALRETTRWRVFDPLARVPATLSSVASFHPSLESSVEGVKAVVIFRDGRGIGDVEPRIVARLAAGRPVIDCVGALLRHRAELRALGVPYICRGEAL